MSLSQSIITGAGVVGKDTASPPIQVCAAAPCKDALVVGRADDLQLKTVECHFPPLSIQRWHINVQQTQQGISSVLDSSRRPIGGPRHYLSNTGTVGS